MRKIAPLVFSMIFVWDLAAQSNGGWGVCEFSTVAALTAFNPSTNFFDCKKAFVQATNEHYHWNGTAWVKDSENVENIYNTSDTLTSDRILEGISNSLFFNGLDSMYVEGTNIELDASNNLTLFADNIISLELDATDGKGLYIDPSGNVGIGISSPATKVHIYEATGSAASLSGGTLYLEHGDSGGASSIVFKSTVNPTSDYAYIEYDEDGSGNGSSAENGLLTIGVENENSASSDVDDIAIMPSGSLGVGTTSPDARLDVEGGSVRFSDYGIGTYVDTTAVYLLGVESDGDVMEMNVAKSARFFYAPSMIIDASTTGTGFTLDLYNEYYSQFATPMVSSSGAPAQIPHYSSSELYFYVTYYDNTILDNVSIDASGVMTYDIIAVPSDDYSQITVVFVVK